MWQEEEISGFRPNCLFLNKGDFSYLTEKGVLDYSVHLWRLDETVFLILTCENVQEDKLRTGFTLSENT